MFNPANLVDWLFIPDLVTDLFQFGIGSSMSQDVPHAHQFFPNNEPKIEVAQNKL